MTQKKHWVRIRTGKDMEEAKSELEGLGFTVSSTDSKRSFRVEGNPVTLEGLDWVIFEPTILHYTS